MAYKNTGAMCMVYVDDKCIDLGNYHTDEASGEKVLITSYELAEKYAHLVSVPVYVRKEMAVPFINKERK